MVWQVINEIKQIWATTNILMLSEDTQEKSNRTDQSQRPSPSPHLNDLFREELTALAVLPASAHKSLPTVQNSARDRTSEDLPEESPRSISRADVPQTSHARPHDCHSQSRTIHFLHDRQARYASDHSQVYHNLQKSKNLDKTPNQPTAPQTLQFFHYRFIHQPSPADSMQDPTRPPREYTSIEGRRNRYDVPPQALDGEQRGFIQTSTPYQFDHIPETEAHYVGSFDSMGEPQHTEKRADQPTAVGSIQTSHGQPLRNRPQSGSAPHIDVRFPSLVRLIQPTAPQVN